MSRILLLAGLLGSGVAAQAQTALVIPLTPDALPGLSPYSPLKISVVHLRNIPPTMAAHWLNPANTPISILEQNSRTNWLKSGESLKTLPAFNPPVTVSLPPGISVIKPLDDQNALLMSGSIEAVNQVMTSVKQLDVPLKQIEIDYLAVALSLQAFNDLNLDLQSAGVTTSGDKLWLAKSGVYLEPRITAWIKDGKAQSLGGGRFPVIEGMVGAIGNGFSQQAIINGKDGRDGEPPFDEMQSNVAEKPRLEDMIWVTCKAWDNPNQILSADFRLSRVLALQFERSIQKPDGVSLAPSDIHILQVIDSFSCPLSGTEDDTFVLPGFSPTNFYGRDPVVVSMLKDKKVVDFIRLKRVRRTYFEP